MLVLALLMLWTPMARADQPLPEGASASNMSLVGSLELPGGAADVWVHGDFAYVGTWYEPECPGLGVKIVDVSDPSAPALVGSLAQHEGTSAEDFTVISVQSPTFEGDLLAVGLQTCADAGLNGVEFWDVTDPTQPQFLSFFETADTTGVHEMSLIQRPSDGLVLASLAVPYAENPDTEQLGEYQFVDATDPLNPVLLSEWSIGDRLEVDVFGGQGQYVAIYGHSVTVNPEGTRAVLSYWDAGFVILDISDASNPTFLGKTTYPVEDEGEAHSSALANDGTLLVAADEDLMPSVQGTRVNAPVDLAGEIESAEGGATLPLFDLEPLSGDLVYLGRACPEGDEETGTGVAVPGGDPLLGDPAGKIALIDRGICSFDYKIERAEAAGAIAVVMVQNQADEPPFSMGGGDVAIDRPGVMIGLADGDQIKAALEAGTTVNVTLDDDIVSSYNDWGYLRLFDITDPANPVEVGRFGTENTFTDPLNGPPTPDGIYSVHNPLVEGDLVFASWYSDGVRAIDISDPANPVEVGFFIPPPVAALSFGTGDQADVWGVVKQGDLLFLSDQDYGLWIVRYPGAEEEIAPPADDTDPAQTGSGAGGAADTAPAPPAPAPAPDPAPQVPVGLPNTGDSPFLEAPTIRWW